MTSRDIALTEAFQRWRDARDRAQAAFQSQVQRHNVEVAALKAGFEAECEAIDRQYQEKIGDSFREAKQAYAPNQR